MSSRGALDDLTQRKLQFISVWLQQVFGERSVPPFEITSETVDILYSLACRSRLAESAWRECSKHWNSAAQEYNSEADRLRVRNASMGIPSASELPESSQQALEALTSLAVSLELSDSRLSSYYCALTDVENNRENILQQRSEDEQLVLRLQESSRVLFELLSVVERTNRAIEDSLPSVQQQIGSEQQDLTFFSAKMQQYEQNIQQMKDALVKKCGFDRNISHESIVESDQVVKQVQSACDTLQNTLNKFGSLPPDAMLAKVTIAETKSRLQQLEGQLLEKVSQMMR